MWLYSDGSVTLYDDNPDDLVREARVVAWPDGWEPAPGGEG